MLSRPVIANSQAITSLSIYEKIEANQIQAAADDINSFLGSSSDEEMLALYEIYVVPIPEKRQSILGLMVDKLWNAIVYTTTGSHQIVNPKKHLQEVQKLLFFTYDNALALNKFLQHKDSTIKNFNSREAELNKIRVQMGAAIYESFIQFQKETAFQKQKMSQKCKAQQENKAETIEFNKKLEQEDEKRKEAEREKIIAELLAEEEEAKKEKQKISTQKKSSKKKAKTKTQKKQSPVNNSNHTASQDLPVNTDSKDIQTPIESSKKLPELPVGNEKPIELTVQAPELTGFEKENDLQLFNNIVEELESVYQSGKQDNMVNKLWKLLLDEEKLPVITFLITSHPNYFKITGPSSYETPLHILARRGQFETLQLLLTHLKPCFNSHTEFSSFVMQRNLFKQTAADLLASSGAKFSLENFLTESENDVANNSLSGASWCTVMPNSKSKLKSKSTPDSDADRKPKT